MTATSSIRHKCLDCCGGSSKVVAYCACDGVNSSKCDLWMYRMGVRPDTAKRKYARLMNPREMPDPNAPIEELPSVGEFLKTGLASVGQTSASVTVNGE